MAKKIIFCILDTSGLISKNSANLDPWKVFGFITNQFLELMKKYVNSRPKKILMRNIDRLTKRKDNQLVRYFEFFLE